MNRVAIYGGLGNQMFQYALNSSLNLKGKKSRIYFSNFLLYDHHNGFSLCRTFNMHLPFPQNVFLFILNNFRWMYKNRVCSGILRRTLPNIQKICYNEYREKAEFEFDSEVFLQEGKFFHGVWQHELYFKEFEKQIFNDFEFKLPGDKTNLDLMNLISANESVSLHVRRGDYLSKEWDNILGVIKGKIYYENAIKYIEEKVENPVYFVFSDDIKWVKENLKVPNCTYVVNNTGFNSHFDMYLMSLCKHNIIANSTFSWWSARLNKNINKIVIMPERWVIGKTCDGLYPNDWVKLKIE